ncbi:nuclease-related domain-containing protein [Fictibacillus enclensis]|uniref:nuclease-related domain-containing protein n=1 Tax=Fictibacillus enclensis TaxID=1017270 RepID=UPI0025A08C87|nr:nuclease-related domain-containing protein [Fictibacillus enclensis]MDM5200536.1 nuclease-related domain-containing protein [Fictibacillus enclensis]
MIVKKRQLPLMIQKLQSLLRRLPKNHPKIPYIEENLAKKMAGYRGEYSIDYPLSFLSSQNYFILHDLRLPHNDYFFQIDTLLISSRFIVILEVKNIAGKLFFDQEFHQLVRTLNGKEEVFPDPLLQVKRQETQLRAWLIKHKITEVPIKSFVVISNPNSQIMISPEHKYLRKTILHREALPIKITELDACHQHVMPDKQLKKIIRLLLKQHSEANSDVLEHFEIERHELLKGVQCVDCGLIPMERRHGSWFCPSGYCTCKTAHLDALRDYNCLINTTITNQQAREFLLLSSRNVVNRILRSISTHHEGNHKSTIYHLPSSD